MPEKEADEAKQRAIDQITRAFDGVSREDGVSLHEAIALDDYATPAQRAAARALDTETRWQDVPDEDIEHGELALCFFDPTAFRYYLPAYMIWSLRNSQTDQFHMARSLIFHLSLSLSRHPEYKLSRFRALTPEQSAAVCSFLRYTATRIDKRYAERAHQALNGHWSEFYPGQ